MLTTLRLAACRQRHVSISPYLRTVRASSTWGHVPAGPPAILGITEAFQRDPFEQKINLGVGAYRDAAGKPYVLNVVRAAEEKILTNHMNKEYPPITGIPDFVPAAIKLAYKDDSPALDRIAAAQSISGTGALRLGAAFLDRFYSTSKAIFLPTPSWANHEAVFSTAGLEVKRYRYYNPNTIGLDFDGMLADIQAAPQGSIFLLHACAHNPTGVDPTQEQWLKISEVMKQGQHLAFFDMAYQGFATGDIDRDAFALRHFVSEGHQVCLAQSFAKNMGLYGERVGAFSILCADPEEKKRIESQLKIIIRTMYSNPPIHGARIAASILNDPAAYEEWRIELKGMADRIITMRELLRSNLERLGSSRDWSHITNQIGMFAYTGLTASQMDLMAKEYSVYATRDGRISVAGINESNVGRLAEVMHKITA